jgi:hypothetical protein
MNAKNSLVTLTALITCLACGPVSKKDQSSTVVDLREILDANGHTPTRLMFAIASVLSKNNSLSVSQLFSYLDTVLTLHCEEQCRVQEKNQTLTWSKK